VSPIDDARLHQHTVPREVECDVEFAPVPPFVKHEHPRLHLAGSVWLDLRVRVEIIGSQKCGIVGKSQSVLIMINPIISTRTRTK
jgi:hypothetical protein